ncbi:MAG: MFS transporter [Gammaproteobacteria bacterium]|nr:MFS transporter [Gammaproteobacteria bacterium]
MRFRTGLKLLRRPDVNRLFIAYLITYTGTAMAPIAIAFGVLELTGSTRDTAIVIAAPTIASIAVLLFGGVLADRTSRQRIIVFAEGLAMVAQFWIAYLFLSNTATVPFLTFLMLANGIAMALNAPAALGLITQIVERDELQAVNALLGTARNGAMAGGAALGGILVATFGAGVTLMIDSVSFGVSALLVLSLKPRLQVPPAKASLIEDLRIGWKEFTSHTWLWVIVLQFSMLVAAMESVFGLIGPAVALEHMNGAIDWGFIAASFGVGTLVGGILSLKVNVKYPMRLGTILVFSFCSVPLALAVPLPVYLVSTAAFVEGVAGQIFAVLWYTSIQHKVPGQMLSRVSAYDHLGSIVLAPLGLVAGGLLFEQIGFRATLLIAALVVILPTMLAFSVRDVRMMTISKTGADNPGDP